MSPLYLAGYRPMKLAFACGQRVHWRGRPNDTGTVIGVESVHDEVMIDFDTSVMSETWPGHVVRHVPRRYGPC